VDIILGGAKKERGEVDSAKEYEKLTAEWKKRHDDVIATGGLHVIGTERHESRRIDNQLRGRSGRQGDPGSSRFFVSLEDDIMRLFGGDQVAKLMTIFKLPEDVPLEHGMVSKAIEQAQTKVEGFHFDSRKHLVEYDDVLNKHREIVYRLRRDILEGKDQKQTILDDIAQTITNAVTMYAGEDGSVDTDKIVSEFISIIPFDPQSQKELQKELQKKGNAQEISGFLSKIASDMYEAREKQITPEVMRQVERWVSLGVIDNLWMEHLDAIDDLREGIGLRGYGQRDPLIEYKNEAYTMFERLMVSINSEIVHRIYKVQVQTGQQNAPQARSVPASDTVPAETKLTREAKRARTNEKQVQAASLKSGQSGKSLGRNDPCPCGSGKKWKKCHYPEIPM
jgi:preprotein translocase subunit SecA